MLTTLVLIPLLLGLVAVWLRAHTARRRRHSVPGQALRYLEQALLDDAAAVASYR